MIERYTTAEMRHLWSPQHKTQKWLDVEIAVCDGLEHFGKIPAGTTAKIRDGATFDLARIAELEKETRHDVMAFVKNVAENLGAEGRYVHYGVTSYDIVDTALALLLRDATDQIIARAKFLMEVIRKPANGSFKNTVMIGRTHGIHAEPITFAFKLATWLDEMNHNHGAIGTGANGLYQRGQDFGRGRHTCQHRAGRGKVRVQAIWVWALRSDLHADHCP